MRTQLILAIRYLSRRKLRTLLTTLATLSNLDKTAGAGTYVQKSYSVLGYKGQTVKVRFKATNGTSYVTTFRVDDVSLMTD